MHHEFIEINTQFHFLNCYTSYFFQLMILEKKETKANDNQKFVQNFIFLNLFFGIYPFVLYSNVYPLYKSEPLTSNTFLHRKITLLSVVIPVFNKEKYLKGNIFDPIKTTDLDMEFVIVDDGSSDNSTSLIQNAMVNDSRVVLVRNYYNKGLFYSRYNGILMASGKYIFNLDPDDFLYFENAYNITEKADFLNSDIIESTGQIRSIDGTIRRRYRCKREFPNSTIIKTAFVRGRIPLHLWKRAMKKSMLLKAYKYASQFLKNKCYTFAEDVLAVGFIYYYSNAFYCSPMLTYVYYNDTIDNSRSGTYQPQRQNDIQLSYAQSVLDLIRRHISQSEELSFNQLMKNKTVKNLYDSIINYVSKPPSFDCVHDVIDGLVGKKFDYYELCYIETGKRT